MLVEHVAERHGAARARDGWDDATLAAEFAVVRDTVGASLARRVGGAAIPAADALGRRLDAAERTARDAARAAVGVG